MKQANGFAGGELGVSVGLFSSLCSVILGAFGEDTDEQLIRRPVLHERVVAGRSDDGNRIPPDERAHLPLEVHAAGKKEAEGTARLTHAMAVLRRGTWVSRGRGEGSGTQTVASGRLRGDQGCKGWGVHSGAPRAEILRSPSPPRPQVLKVWGEGHRFTRFMVH